VFVAATPREFDWLFAEGTLSTNVLGAVSQVVRVRFDPVDDIPAAVDTASAADRTLDSSAVWSAFGSSGEPDPRYVYEGYEMERYESPRFANAVRAYERTLVPRAVKTVPPEADDTDVPGVLTSMGSKIGLAEFWGSTKELVTGAGVATGVVAGTAASGPVAPIVGAIGLAAFLRLSDWDDSITDERLLPQAFAPHERAQFETAMQFPPGTIARLRTLGAGELPDSATDDLVDNEEFEAAVERHESELEQIRGLVDGLQGWRRERLIGATDPLEELAARLENEESNVLGEPVSFDEIPYEVQRDAAADGPDDRRRAVTQAVSESELVVLSGPRGTGKTTTAYRAFRELAAEYEIRLGRFAYDSASEVKEALEAVPDETLLFLQYRSGEYTVRDDRHLEDVLRFLDDGVCSRVVIETRSEESDELDEAMPTQGSDTRHALWNDRETVEFSRFGTDSASIRTIAEWALDTAGYDGDEAAREETISDVRRLAEGSPEFVKIAARFAAREGRSLAEIDTQDELVWKDVRAGLNTNRDTQERRVLQRLAAFGRVTTAELREMVDRPTEVIDTLEGYLAGSVTDDDVVDPSEELWRLSPSIYRRVLFQRFVFEGEADPRLFDRLLQDAHKNSDNLFSRLAGVVGDVFETATESDDEQLREDVRECAETLVEWADECTDDEAYHLVIRRLLFSGVPLATDSLDAERLVSGGIRNTAESDLDPLSVLGNICSYILSNNIKQKSLDIKINIFVKKISTSSDFNLKKLLINTYAIAIANLADDHRISHNKITSWVNRLDIHIRDTASDFNSKLFLTNVYAIAISNLAEDYNPAAHTIPTWIRWINGAILEAAERTDTETAELVMETYALAFHHIAEYHTVNSIWEWLRLFEEMLQQNESLKTGVCNRYREFIDIFVQDSLPKQRFKDWGTYFMKLLFRIIDVDVPSSFFRRHVQMVHEGSLFLYTKYVSTLYKFETDKFDNNNLVRNSARFLDTMSEFRSEVTQTAVVLVAHELRHVNADLNTVLPAIRQQLRSEHENGQMAGRWRAHFVGEWPE